MKPTVKNLSDYFGIHFNTVQKWKKERPKIYQALKENFVKMNKINV